MTRRFPDICRKCGVALTDDNWPEYLRRMHSLRCVDCRREQVNANQRNWYKTPKGQAKKQRRRQETLGSRKGAERSFIRIEGKREYPDPAICEMCQEPKTRLVYHHWNDADYSQGLWVCQGCHNVAHTWEDKRPRMARYRALKQMVGAKPYAGMVTK